MQGVGAGLAGWREASVATHGSTVIPWWRFSVSCLCGGCTASTVRGNFIHTSKQVELKLESQTRSVNFIDVSVWVVILYLSYARCYPWGTG